MWMMTFNINKCEVLQISLQCTIIENSYLLYDQPLKLLNKAKYLDAVIDSKLTFNTQVNSVCKRENSALSFYKKNLYSCEREVKAEAYQIYVRPILEYAVCAWLPMLNATLINLKLFRGMPQHLLLGIFA